ncbi:unnamed protein product [Enterobius vermicularis]|uniref:Uncharacterized protein n=1 Tax=Enterobius vermicularis TaxID=51028 RepID=A0A0N4V3J8_ENTVE|nr:unnamed protein product [Enterobius vermicularis]
MRITQLWSDCTFRPMHERFTISIGVCGVSYLEGNEHRVIISSHGVLRAKLGQVFLFTYAGMEFVFHLIAFAPRALFDAVVFEARRLENRHVIVTALCGGQNSKN